MIDMINVINGGSIAVRDRESALGVEEGLGCCHLGFWLFGGRKVLPIGIKDHGNTRTQSETRLIRVQRSDGILGPLGR